MASGIPYLVIDSSYFLIEATNERFDNFLEWIDHLQQLKNAQTIILRPIRCELEHILSCRETDTKNECYTIAKKKLENIPKVFLEFKGKDQQLYEFLNNKAREIGIKLSSMPDKKFNIMLDKKAMHGKTKRPEFKEGVLSSEDRTLCAYSIFSAREREVILATRDNLIIKTIDYMQKVVREPLKSQGYDYKDVAIGRDLAQVKEYLSSLKVKIPNINNIAV